MRESVLLAIAAALCSCTGALAQPRLPTGPAAPAIERWYYTDLSLSCFDQNAATIPCTLRNTPIFQAFYGNAKGGPGQPDALTLVTYLPDPVGNGQFMAIAQFRQTPNGTYRFVRRLPNMIGGGVAEGTTVTFANGQASWIMLVMTPGDSYGMPTGRKRVRVPLQASEPAAPPSARVAHNSLDIPGGRVVTTNTWDERDPRSVPTSVSELNDNNHSLSIQLDTASPSGWAVRADNNPISAGVFGTPTSLTFDRAVQGAGYHFVILTENEGPGAPSNYWIVDVSGPEVRVSSKIPDCTRYTVAVSMLGATFRCSRGARVQVYHYPEGLILK